MMSKLFFFGIFFVFLSIFLFEYAIVGQAVYGDGRYYWAFTRSLYFSNDIDISDEMAHFYSPESNNTELFFGTVAQELSKTKLITNSFSLGISIVWLPFYLIADVLVVVLKTVGIPIVRNGYSDAYQLIVGAGNILFVVVGMRLLFSALQQFFTTKTAYLTVLVTGFGTHLLYYGSLDVINSHPFSFFLVSLLVWLVLRSFKQPLLPYFFLQGVVVGVLATNRTQDGLFIVLGLAAAFLLQKRDNVFIGRYARAVLVLLGAFIGYLPQVVLLSFGQGHFAFLPHTDQGFVVPQHFLGILFGPKLGLFYYVPIVLVSSVGLLLLTKKHTFVLVFLVVIALQYVLLASWEAWHQAAYSMRYLISSLPLFAFGLAEILRRSQKNVSVACIFLCILLIIFHQVIMIAGFKLFWQDPTYVGQELSQSGKLKMTIITAIEEVLPTK